MTHSTRGVGIGVLAERLRTAGLLVDARIPAEAIIGNVTADSRSVAAGTAFVAVAGERFDGHIFAAPAVEAGAAAIVSERPFHSRKNDVAVLQVRSSRHALALAASAIAGDPAMRMTSTAVTGTNGKTTTAWLVSQALSQSKKPCGYIGTLGFGMPGKLKEATHTTPDPVALHRLLAELEADGANHCALEASSHAIHQHRISGIPFAAAVFTNLTRDHLDYHGDAESYLQAKSQLFKSLASDAIAVVNMDDPAWERMVEGCVATVVTYGRNTEADIHFTVRSDRADGLKLRIDGLDAQFRLSGTFNAYNLAAAYGALAAHGLKPDQRMTALSEAPPAPGRFELIPIGNQRVAIIDYAHTPDALKNVLEAAQGVLPAGAELWCVFGCGGDRDTGKRPLMGRIAEEMANRVVVTSDNPRTEDPEAILDDIRAGVDNPERMHWLADRRQAIRRAVQSARPGDVVLVAGKGPEPYQVVGTEKLPFSDEDEVRAAAGA